MKWEIEILIDGCKVKRKQNMNTDANAKAQDKLKNYIRKETIGKVKQKEESNSNKNKHHDGIKNRGSRRISRN